MTRPVDIRSPYSPRERKLLRIRGYCAVGGFVAAFLFAQLLRFADAPGWAVGFVAVIVGPMAMAGLTALWLGSWWKPPVLIASRQLQRRPAEIECGTVFDDLEPYQREALDTLFRHRRGRQ